jgi:hypothetical protein
VFVDVGFDQRPSPRRCEDVHGRRINDTPDPGRQGCPHPLASVPLLLTRSKDPFVGCYCSGTPAAWNTCA